MKKIKIKAFGNLTAILLLLLSLFLLPTSCNKQGADQELLEEETTAAATTQEEPAPVKYLYFLDSKEVIEGTFDPSDERMIIDVTGEKDPEVVGGGIIKIWAFTSEESYIDWGNRYGMPVQCAMELERHLAEYAESSGAIAHYERTGEVLPEYEAYVADYYLQMGCGKDGGAVERGTGILFKDISGGPANYIYTTKAVMWAGWNDTVSRYRTLGIYNGLVVYNKTFFRKKLKTIWNWGWTDYTFTGPLSNLNDRMSSGIVL